MIHLRPTGDIEYSPYHSGVYWNGEFIKAYPAAVKMLQLLLENEGKFISIYKIMKTCSIGRTSVKVYINRTRPLIYKIGFSVFNEPELGYKVVKMVKK